MRVLVGAVTIAEVLYALLALVLPIGAGLLAARWLKRAARLAAGRLGLGAADTVAHTLRGPLRTASWLLGAYLTTTFVRKFELDWARRLDWDAVDRWLLAAAILLAFHLGYRVMFQAIRAAALRAGRDPSDVALIRKVLGALFVVVAALTVLSQLGVSIGPVLASLGVAGLAVALALKDTLANYFAGITLAIDKPFTVGDFIRLDGGHEGRVEAIGWRSTRLLSKDGATITVPNEKLTTSVVVKQNPPAE
ncbi:MAG: mechanosensitive ion channel [Armatimonadetes bacterium]|nr:mechanosensitive ion channel [Armatimonadota bacterium]